LNFGLQLDNLAGIHILVRVYFKIAPAWRLYIMRRAIVARYFCPVSRISSVLACQSLSFSQGPIGSCSMSGAGALVPLLSGMPGVSQCLSAGSLPAFDMVITDHSARPGDGTTVSKTLFRIEESTLRQEIEAAGFKPVAEANFLRHPEDPRTASVFQPQVPTDEFVLKYQKPS
jgi:hypothetical protein